MNPKKDIHMIGHAHLDPAWFWPWTEGMSEIKFSYKTPGLGTGAVMSLSAGAVLIIYVVLCFVWYKKHPVAVTYPEGEELLEGWKNELEEESLTSAYEIKTKQSDKTAKDTAEDLDDERQA